MSQIPADKARLIWSDMSSALAYIHSQDVLHHDIKPENILLSSSGAKLCDFGTSCRASQKKAICNGGTPCYIPPEFLLNERSRPSDVWALRVSLLFVFRFIPLPSGNWRIAHVKSDDRVQDKMLTWLQTLESVKSKMPSEYQSLVDMLNVNPSKRIIALTLVSELKRRRRPRPQAQKLAC